MKAIRVKLLPEIHYYDIDARKIVLEGISYKTSNPDLYVSGLGYVDLKIPKHYKNIVHNATKASKQGTIALILDALYKGTFDEQTIKTISNKIFGDKNYSTDLIIFDTSDNLTIMYRNK